MELLFIIWLVPVLLAGQVTDAGQIDPVTGHQDGQDLRVKPTGPHSEAVTDHCKIYHEIILFGQHIRTQLPQDSNNVDAPAVYHTDYSLPANHVSQICDLSQAPPNSHFAAGNTDDVLLYDDLPVASATEGTLNREPSKELDINDSQVIPVQSSSITIDTLDCIINYVVDDEPLDTQPLVKRRRVSDLISLPPTDRSPTLMADTTEISQIGSNHDSNEAADTKKRKRSSRSGGKFKPEADLNLKSIKENYEELCRLLPGKEQNAAELSFLETSTPNRSTGLGRKSAPITIEVNGDQIHLTEWLHICYAKTTLVKLILIARFCQKLDPIWDNIPTLQKSNNLSYLYHNARTIMLCLTHCCQNDLIKFQEGRDNPFKHRAFQGQRCPDHKLTDINNEILQFDTGLNVTYLNLRTVDDNYRDLCSLLARQVDVKELTGLKEWIPKGRCHNKGPKPDPVTVDINGECLYLTEWSQMRSAQCSVVKLIAAVRFYQKLHPLWNEISSDQKTKKLQRQYRCVSATMFCLRHCCDNNLLEFYQRWGNPFKHKEFSNRCCSAVFRPGSQCGFFGDKNQRRNNALPPTPDGPDG